ncbi:MAG: PEP-CTERM sorting domain-containing protein [Planctomycetota bacterium]
MNTLNRARQGVAALVGCLVLLALGTPGQAQLLPIVIDTADLGVPTGVGIADGGFETSGLGGFTPIGVVDVVGTVSGDPLLSPSSGSSQVFLQTGDGSNDNFIANPLTADIAPDVALDVFLGLAPGAIDGFIGITDLDGESEGATEGSAVRQTFEVLAPTTLSFDFNFATDELDQPSAFSDTAFFVLDGEISLLGNVEDDDDFTDTTSAFEFDGATGFQNFSVSLDPGVHTIGFGVVDVSDAVVNSALLIDNITVSPEPGTGLLVGLAAAVGLTRRRRGE